MPTTFRPRRQPCSRCGEKVVLVEVGTSGLGGLLRRPPRVALIHADTEPADAPADRVDGSCTRPTGTAG